MENIGQRLKEERQLRGWSQRDLARETGVNTDTISGIETGQHEPRPSTLRKLAEGLGIEVRDLFMELALPKAEAPREAGRANWDAAVRNARRLRENGQVRAEELLALWRESKDREEAPVKRRPYLDEMGDLLQAAYDARSALQDNASTLRLDRIPIPEWEEIAEADRLYWSLSDMVLEAGLSIHRERKTHEVKDAA